MKLNNAKFKKIHSYEEGKGDVLDQESQEKAASYKKNFLKHFISINQNQIDQRLGGEKYYVTRKYDGEYAIIFFENGKVVTVNRSGRVRRGIPCIDEAGEILTKAGLKEAIIPAEIYVHEEGKRTRTNDLISVLAGKDDINKLRLAAFDILELDDKPYKPETYQDTINKLNELLKGGEKVHPVDMEVAPTNKEVKNIFNEWVSEGDTEGLVVRSAMPFVFKIKPRHNIDVVVIGFTEGTGDQKGKVRTLLGALMPEEGQYQVAGHIGGGMTEKLKAELYKKFTKKIIKSEFIETDSNFVAFHMIKPETVMEVEVNDVIYETYNGKITNSVLEIQDNTYRLLSTVEGLSFIAPIFQRIREDKKADADDVRLSQVEEISNSEPEDRDTIDIAIRTADLPKSKLLVRDVYRKELGSKVMVQKYMVWKTNKEQTGDYTAYVFYYTNFSSDRKEPLQREVNISDSFDQIIQLKDKAIEENVKKGWSQVDSFSDIKKKGK